MIGSATAALGKPPPAAEAALKLLHVDVSQDVCRDVSQDVCRGVVRGVVRGEG